jgi:hypothetical protein
MTKRIFNRSFAELDALAKKAVSQAVGELHAKAIPTYHMEGGQMIETAPNGTRTHLKTAAEHTAKRLAAA